MEEIWKSIEGYPYYEVSNTGSIRSYNSTKGKCKKNPHILSPSISKHGYKLVVITDCNHVPRTFAVHRLVAKTFILNPNNYKCVNHKDRNKINNNVENLEWCSYSYNNNYEDANRRRSETLVNKKHLFKPVLQLDSSDTIVNEYPSVTIAARTIGSSKYAISMACRGKNNHLFKGYIWKFKDINLRS